MTVARRLLARYHWMYRAEMRRREIASRLTRRGLVRRYLAGEPEPKLHIGAGEHLLDGWLNTDVRVFRRGRIMYMDARRPFPIPSGSFAYVLSEHQIEHVTRRDAARMLGECRRVLRPGGRIRVATPDLAWVASLVQPPLSPENTRYVAWMSRSLGLPAPDPAGVVNALVRDIEAEPGAGHKYLYSFDALCAALEEAGFRDVVRRAMQQSDVPALRGVEGHGNLVGEEFARLESLIVEAERP